MDVPGSGRAPGGTGSSVTGTVLETPEAQADPRHEHKFDLDAAMAAIPPAAVWVEPTISEKGQAGSRLSSRFTTTIPDDLLAEMARSALGAERCSAKYLSALRIVLGNQARAEYYGYVLEMNQRVDFASARVMRNIIDQMHATRLTFGRVVVFGQGRSQEVQCFVNRENHSGDPVERLEAMYRKAEGESPYPADQHPVISDKDFTGFARP